MLTVLLDAPSFTFRVMWTGVAAAIGSGLVLPLALMVDRARTRPAGLFGLAAVVVQFILAVALIWIPWIFTRRIEEELALTLFFTAMMSLGAFVSLSVVRTKGGRTAGLTGTAVAAVMLVCFFVAIWWPGGFNSEPRWYGTGWALGGIGLLAVITLIGAGVVRRWWRWPAIVYDVIVAGLALLEVWRPRGLLSEELLFTVVSAAVLLAYANAVLQLSLRGGQRWVRTATLVVVLLTCIVLNVLVHDGTGDDSSLLARFAVAGAIVSGCGTMALAVLAVFNRRGEVEPGASPLTDVTVICPRCRRKQTLPVGNSACGACGLRFSIRLEEPRCHECGYLLLGLTSDRCPECGTGLTGGAARPDR